MKTIEREEAGIQTRTRFEPKDVLKQVVIAALAVAPDGQSIVYVKRTVEDGKYARRLWRTTFDGGRPGTGSTIETSSPASRSHDETNLAIAPSPAPPGTRSGFTDSISTSRQTRSSRSLKRTQP